MDEARQVLARLERIDALRRTGAPNAQLLAELRELLADGRAWASAEGLGTDRARAALAGLESALSRTGNRPGSATALPSRGPGR